jgi:hypothetical protein
MILTHSRIDPAPTNPDQPKEKRSKCNRKGFRDRSKLAKSAKVNSIKTSRSTWWVSGRGVHFHRASVGKPSQIYFRGHSERAKNAKTGRYYCTRSFQSWTTAPN